MLFTPTCQLVQTLLAARRDLVEQTADEAEVLFTLMAERYERRSLTITSNLVFGAWNRSFMSPMTTTAAIDRLVHDAAIIEIDRGSVGAEEARKRNPKKSMTGDET